MPALPPPFPVINLDELTEEELRYALTKSAIDWERIGMEAAALTPNLVPELRRWYAIRHAYDTWWFRNAVHKAIARHQRKPNKVRTPKS